MITLTERSKYLSYLLRHKPEKANLTLDKDGWCVLDQLLTNTDFIFNEIENIVNSDSKGRYTIKLTLSGEKVIRANQGHSTTKVKMTFKTAIPPIKLYHGTDEASVEAIFKNGLLPMNRHHVHLSADISTAESVAGRRRRGYQILVVDTKAMVTDGLEFFISENGVWLIKHVAPKYLLKLEAK